MHTAIRPLVQPDDGARPVEQLIDSAVATLCVKQFTLTHPALLDAMVRAKKRGVDVRVMLNERRSGGSRPNDDAFALLESAGVEVRWANPEFHVTHEKSMVVDRDRVLLATFNLCEKYFTHTRDYGLLIEDRQVASEVAACFEADWNRKHFDPPDGSALLWSNAGSRRHVADFIDAAQDSLDVQHPKFVDTAVLDRIVAAAARGVKVRVLCGGRHGISDIDVLDTFSSLRVMRHAGVKIHKQKHLRAHAKLLLADGERILLGSMNLDRSAFDLRRELGIRVRDHGVVQRLQTIFEADWDASHRYDIPDPLHPLEESDFPHDTDLHHE